MSSPHKNKRSRPPATGEPYQFEAEFITARDTHKWVRAAGECERQNGEPIRLFGIFQDITDERNASEHLWRAANYDEVTGLGNRRYFNDELRDAIASCDPGEDLVLMILDLDNFKQINDTRGHDVGDQILAEVGRRLAHVMATDDIVARLGGDEFALIIRGNLSKASIDEYFQRILGALRQPIRIGASHVYVEGTLGVARYPGDASDAAELLRKADIGLYSAKQMHRGSALAYTPDMADFFEKHGRAMDVLRNALAHGRLFPFYQPKIRFDNGLLHSFEALARIVAEDGTVIGPSVFGPAFEDRVMARRIGRRMLEQITSDLGGWCEEGLAVPSISLNVSEFDFADGKFMDRVLRRLDDLQLSRSCMTVEVTESVFLGDKAALAKKALLRLDQEGIKVELDDFGTGYASLTHLRAIPVSRLKIDRSFVRNLERDDGDRTIVQAVIDLGHKLGCEIIAEGVETQEQHKILADMGCDIGQGYLFGEAANAERTKALLVDHCIEKARFMLRAMTPTSETTAKSKRTG